MASPTLTDEQLAEKYGRRPHPEAIPLFEPFELGYRCPKGHGGGCISWSEFNDHIWCHKCEKDYHYAKDCTLQHPSWMSDKDWEEFVAKLPEKPKILEGLDRTLEPM